MALSLATAALASAVIGGGAAIYSAGQQNKATGKALDAQTIANDKALDLQREQFDRVQGLQQPFVEGGYGGFDALLQELGMGGGGAAPVAPRAQAWAPQGGGAAKTMGGPAGTSPMEPGSRDAARVSEPGRAPAPTGPAAPRYAGAPAAPTYAGGEPDYQAYWDANPDLAINNASTPDTDLTGDGQINDADRAAKHWQEFGQTEGRQLSTTPRTMTDPGTPDYMNAERPDAGPMPDYQRAQDMAVPEFRRGPDMAAPNSAKYFENFEADPGAAYRRDEALAGVNANSAVRGKLRSGDAAKALATLSSNLASQEYNNWFGRQQTKFNNDNQQYQYGQNRSDTNFTQDRSYGTNLWNTQQVRADNNWADDRAYDTSKWQYNAERGDQNFNVDRGYQTNRADTRVSNLFDVARLGAGAASSVGGAGASYANNAGNIFGNQADATGAAASSRAGANAGAVGAIGGIASNLFANWGGGGRAAPVTPGVMNTPWNPTFVNTPASIRF